MKRQKIQLIIMLLLLVLAAAVFLGIKSYNTHRNEEEIEESEPVYTVLDLNEADVEGFSFTNANGSYSFEKVEGSNEETGWRCLEDEALELDPDKVASLLNKALFIQADTAIEDVSDMEQYGLSESETLVYITTSGGTDYKLTFGDYNEITFVYYFSLNDENTVYMSDSDIGSNFEITLDELVPDEEITEEED